MPQNYQSLKNNFILVSLFTGLACAALLILSTFFVKISLLLVLLVTLGSTVLFALNNFRYGTQSSLFSLITIFIVITIFGSFSTSISYIIFLFIPISICCWLLGLRYFSDGTIDNSKLDLPQEDNSQNFWFPLSDCLLILILYIGFASFFIGLFLQDYQPIQKAISSFSMVFSDYLHQNFDNDTNIQNINLFDAELFLEKNFLGILMLFTAINSFSFTILSTYLGLKITQSRKEAVRPFMPWPVYFYVPPVGVAIFIFIAITAYVLPVSLNVFYIPFLGLFTLAFSLSGLFYLHKITQPLKIRPLILTVVYITLFTGVMSTLLFFMGIFVSCSGFIKTKLSKS